MKSACLALIPFLLLMVGGCTVPVRSTVTYTAPDLPEEVFNEVIIDEPFDAVWDRLISRLASEFFVITNIERASGLITLDFSTQAPEQYVDCGITKRTYGDREIVYETSGGATYSLDQINGTNVTKGNVVRTAELSGAINVHVSEVPNGTRVTVNVRYIHNLKYGGTYRVSGIFASSPTQAYQPTGSTRSFNTNSPHIAASDDEISCGSNGELEAMILDAARPRD